MGLRGTTFSDYAVWTAVCMWFVSVCSCHTLELNQDGVPLWTAPEAHVFCFGWHACIWVLLVAADSHWTPVSVSLLDLNSADHRLLLLLLNHKRPLTWSYIECFYPFSRAFLRTSSDIMAVLNSTKMNSRYNLLCSSRTYRCQRGMY